MPCCQLKITSLLLLQGQVKELDKLAQQFVAAAAKKRKELVTQAKAAADAVDSSGAPDTALYVEYYIKTMQRVLDKGDSYLQQVRLFVLLLLVLLLDRQCV